MLPGSTRDFQNKRPRERGGGEECRGCFLPLFFFFFFFFIYQVDRERQAEQEQPDVEVERVGKNVEMRIVKPAAR